MGHKKEWEKGQENILTYIIFSQPLDLLSILLMAITLKTKIKSYMTSLVSKLRHDCILYT